MAGDAEKKAAKRRAQVWKVYGGLAAVVTILHIALQVLYFKGALVGGFSHGLGLALLAAAYYMCIQGKLREADANSAGEVWLDLFAVTVVVHLGHLLSRWAWLFLSAFPVYGLYLLWGFVSPWLEQLKMQNVQTAMHNAAVAANAEAKAKKHGGKVVYKKAN